jgi:cation diffusion facilitator CzcD-associated flavoprotein CzcO
MRNILILGAGAGGTIVANMLRKDCVDEYGRCVACVEKESAAT